MKLAIVTATTNIDRAARCFETWHQNALSSVEVVVVLNGASKADLRAMPQGYHVMEQGDYLGSVSAFRIGVDMVLKEMSAVDIIACLHDDVEIHEPGWDRVVLRHFQRHPACGLAGFGGALGLGASDIYQVPYNPMQLARVHFRSNLVDAEVHGMRSLVPERVACLDGFSQVGSREFWSGRLGPVPRVTDAKAVFDMNSRPLTHLESIGMVHHAADSALGVEAAMLGWEVWFLPIRCRHLGGQTAVGDQGYQAWAKSQTDGVGDQAFWDQAHKAFYELGRGVLPIRI